MTFVMSLTLAKHQPEYKFNINTLLKYKFNRPMLDKVTLYKLLLTKIEIKQIEKQIH
jgi:hypothetical protein